MEEKDIKQENHINKSNKNKVVIIIGIILILIITIILLMIFNKENPKYNIIFETNGGSLIDTIVVNENDILTKPENPIKENYKFVGWYYNNQLYDFSKPVTSDIKLEARWAKINNISNVELDKAEMTLNLNDAYKFELIAMPEDFEKESVVWESSNPEIVSVDENGNIKALKEGKVVITVTSNNGKYTDKVQVTVLGAETIETSANLNETSSNKNEISSNKDKINSTVTTKPSVNDATPSNKNEQDKVTENEQDKVTEDEKNETSINTTGVSLNTTSLNLTEGDNSKLTATVNPSNANDKIVIWESSNPEIVSVDENGNIKALKPGSVTIIVKTKDGGYIAKATITVNRKKVNVTGVSLNIRTLTLTEGDNSKLTATVNPGNADNKNVTWVSNNPSIVSVDTNGNIKALKPGNAIITVITNDGNYKATCEIKVKEKEPSYSVTIKPYVEVAGTYQYTVAVTKNNNSFNDWAVIRFNNGSIVKPGGTLSSQRYKGITSATIVLVDGTSVTATVNL